MRFECSAGSPRPCQCASVTLSSEESEYIQLHHLIERQTWAQTHA
ncbi:MAG: cysteine-rich CWC family protein [Gammaproteobacteria bacterium]